jgi:uncharacterized protein (TIGR02246 family)
MRKRTSGWRLGVTDARGSIENVVYRVARGYDENDDSVLAQCFTSDAVVDWHGSAQMEGKEAVVAELLRRRARYTDTLPWHVVSSVEVLTETDHAATVRSRYTFSVLGGEPSPALTAVGWYHDEFTREDGAWRISHRRLAAAALP